MNLLSFSGYTGSQAQSNSLFWKSSRAGNLQLSRDKFERHALDAPPCYDLKIALMMCSAASQTAAHWHKEVILAWFPFLLLIFFYVSILLLIKQLDMKAKGNFKMPTNVFFFLLCHRYVCSNIHVMYYYCNLGIFLICVLNLKIQNCGSATLLT